MITDNWGINRVCLGVKMFKVFKRELPPQRHGATFHAELWKILFVCWEIKSIIIRKKGLTVHETNDYQETLQDEETSSNLHPEQVHQ